MLILVQYCFAINQVPMVEAYRSTCFLGLLVGVLKHAAAGCCSMLQVVQTRRVKVKMGNCIVFMCSLAVIKGCYPEGPYFGGGKTRNNQIVLMPASLEHMPGKAAFATCT